MADRPVIILRGNAQDKIRSGDRLVDGDGTPFAQGGKRLIGFATNGAVSTGDVAPWSGPMLIEADITEVSACVKTASTTTAVQIDILISNNNGLTWTTIFTTKLTVDANERTDDTAAIPAVIDTTKNEVSSRSMLRINIDAAGTAEDLTVQLLLSDTVASSSST